jgi:hypothetical protein
MFEIINKQLLRIFRLTSRCKCDIRYSGMLRKVDWLLTTDVSAQTIDLFFKSQAVQEEFYLDCLTLDDGTDRLSRNVGYYQSALRNSAEEGMSETHALWKRESARVWT